MVLEIVIARLDVTSFEIKQGVTVLERRNKI